jgi:hypothetical protein
VSLSAKDGLLTGVIVDPECGADLMTDLFEGNGSGNISIKANFTRRATNKQLVKPHPAQTAMIDNTIKAMVGAGSEGAGSGDWRTQRSIE